MNLPKKRLAESHYTRLYYSRILIGQATASRTQPVWKRTGIIEKGGLAMTVYEIISLAINIAILIIDILKLFRKKEESE